jgi:hypothetical protein
MVSVRRRAATAMIGSGLLLGIAAPRAFAAEGKDKPKRRIELALSIERVGDSVVTSATGLAAIEADLALARKGAPLKRRNGRRAAHGAELTFTRPAAKDRFQELFRGWLESPDKRTALLVVRDEGSPIDEPRGELKRWNLLDAFPKSWKVSSADGKDNDALTEELVVIIEWIEEA